MSDKPNLMIPATMECEGGVTETRLLMDQVVQSIGGHWRRAIARDAWEHIPQPNSLASR